MLQEFWVPMGGKKYDERKDEAVTEYKFEELSKDYGEPNDPEHPDEWPYPDEITTYSVPESLATQIRRRVKSQDPNALVTIVETDISGGWSEYTQENEYNYEVRVNGDYVFHHHNGYTSFTSSWGNGLKALLDWLAEDPENVEYTEYLRLKEKFEGPFAS